MKKLLIITGLTASGKSGLALDIANKYGGEIISCDSVQVYRGLDIGSAKENKDNLKKIKHHLIDIVPAEFSYNVGHFIEDCKKAVAECEKRGNLPIIVGGTAMYVKALLEGYSLGAVKNEEFRLKLQKEAEEKSREYVWNKLNALDSNLASTVHYNNLNRVIRYIELKTFGEPKKEKPIFNDYDILALGINVEKAEIYPKIDARVDKMIELGLIEEVKNLVASGLNLTHTSMNSIGYKEIYNYLMGQTDEASAISLIKQHTRNYAKRQLTFMKTIKNLKIVTINEAKILIEEFLKENDN